jgi:hypothetical protein
LWAALTVAAAVAIAASSAWCAPRHPFAVGAQESVGTATGFAGLILAWQSKFQAELQAAVRALKTDPSAFFALAAASFAYGVFHAAGPGHGKAVLASYMLANETALRRGLLLAGLAALLQGLVAIAIVGAAAAIFRATASEMSDATRLIEFASYAAVAALGARLAWVKGRALSAALRMPAIAPTARGFFCEAIDDPRMCMTRPAATRRTLRHWRGRSSASPTRRRPSSSPACARARERFSSWRSPCRRGFSPPAPARSSPCRPGPR